MWRIIKKSIKIFVVSVMMLVLNFSNFPAAQIKNYLDEQNIVDNFYWSAKLSNVVDKFSVKTAYASPGTRSRTVEFFAGQLLDTVGGQQTNTTQTFPTFNVILSENTVSIKNAFIEFEGQIGAYVSETVPGFVLYFDSCVSPCTPAVAAFMTNTGGLGATSVESQTLTARADVTTEAQIAAYAGAGGTLVAQVGYRDSFATAQATWQSTQARLVITYTYDDTSTTQTNTVYYPLESQTAGDQGSKRASQAATCTLGTNCPKFNYNIVAPEIQTQRSQWFAVNGTITGGTGTDYSSTVRVDTNTASSIAYFEEALSANGGGFRYLMSGLTGHTNNAAHYIERTGTPQIVYVMGGEAALTYSYLNSAGTKTKTIRYPVGEVQTAANSTVKTALTGPNVYLPESGVAIQKAWFRITTSYGAAADTLSITTKVGNNTETAAVGYSVAPPTQNVTDDNVIYHVIPSADYTELQAATAISAKAVQMTSQWTTGAGAVSAELVITYTYTGEASGYQTSLQAFAGQHTGAQALTFTTATGAIGTEMPEATGKQMNGAFLKMSRNKLTTANQAMGANLTTSTCTATNTSTGESDNENSRISLYKDVTSVVTTSDTATYTACYSSATTASTFTGVLVYTYQWTPPPTYEQSAYRFFNNLDSTNVGTPLTAAQDTPATLGSTGVAFRLRILLHVGTSDLAINGQAFKLQFAARSGTCDTGFVGETYADVTDATTGIAYKNNAPADNTALTATSTDPTHGADTIVNQTYEELNDFTNSVAAIPATQDGKWDFALFDNGATAGAVYCFRAIKSDATVLNTYTVIPQITTAAAASITLLLSTSTVNFGNLAPGITNTATTTISVDVSGATNGYNLQLKRDSSTSTIIYGTTVFPDYNPAWDPTGSGNAVITPGNTFTFHVRSADTTSNYSTTWWGANDTDGVAKYAGFATTSQKIMDCAACTSGSTDTSILYRINAPTAQAIGAYNGGITYTALVNS